MRPLVLVALLLSHLAFAADDAPLRCYSPVEIQRIADSKAAADRLAASDAARIRSLEADAGKIPVVPLVVTAVLAIGAGFALGFGVKAATAKP